jgi:hypothetical protein
MTEQALLAVAVAVIVIVIMMKQINNITTKLDDEGESISDPKLYSNFASVIQEKIRAIRLGIETQEFALLEDKDGGAALEKLSDMIRKLVFFETMTGDNSDAASIESELFKILSELDILITTSLKDGEKIADKIREELANSYENLKSRYFIQSM